MAHCGIFDIFVRILSAIEAAPLLPARRSSSQEAGEGGGEGRGVGEGGGEGGRGEGGREGERGERGAGGGEGGGGGRTLSEEERIAKIARKKSLKERIQSQVAGCCWSLCIAHMQNKEKAKVVLKPLLSLLAHSDNHAVLYYSGIASLLLLPPLSFPPPSPRPSSSSSSLLPL